MTLNKQKGNMYAFVTHTWNPIKGLCMHDCKYCYMKVWKQHPLRLVENELNDDLGENNFIFVGSSTDMFAYDVNYSWILRVLRVCRNYPNNTYLFQTKDPKRFSLFKTQFPINSVFGTTIETNRDMTDISKAPSAIERAQYLCRDFIKRKMITIEPILDFDLKEFVELIKKVNPEWINIGADSKGHKLKEPSSEKIMLLKKELEKITIIKNKKNLNRLLKEDKQDA